MFKENAHELIQLSWCPGTTLDMLKHHGTEKPNPMTLTPSKLCELERDLIEEFVSRYKLDDVGRYFDISILVYDGDTGEKYHQSIKNLTGEIVELEITYAYVNLWLHGFDTKLSKLINEKAFPNIDKRPNIAKLFENEYNCITFSNYSDINGVMRPHGLCIVPGILSTPLPDVVLYCGPRGEIH